MHPNKKAGTLFLLCTLVLLGACFHISEPVGYPAPTSDPVLRASIVQNLAFYIRENPGQGEETLLELGLWETTHFADEDRLVLIRKAKEVNHAWDGR
jgi:hypothetical protein